MVAILCNARFVRLAGNLSYYASYCSSGTDLFERRVCYTCSWYSVTPHSPTFHGIQVPTMISIPALKPRYLLSFSEPRIRVSPATAANYTSNLAGSPFNNCLSYLQVHRCQHQNPGSFPPVKTLNLVPRDMCPILEHSLYMPREMCGVRTTLRCPNSRFNVRRMQLSLSWFSPALCGALRQSTFVCSTRPCYLH
jgi:hypothetical protein